MPHARTEIEEAAREPALGGPKQDAYDLGAAGQVDGLPNTEQEAEHDQHAEAGREAGQALAYGPHHKRREIEPAQIDPVGGPADRDLHQGVGPEESREQQALAFRAQAQVFGQQGQGERDAGAVEVVDQEGGEQQPHDGPTPGIGGDFIAESSALCELASVSRHDLKFYFVVGIAGTALRAYAGA